MNNAPLLFPPQPKSILFVCTGNSCRSVFAEGVLKEMLAKEGLDIDVHSAGTDAFPGQSASLRILYLLSKRGIDVSTHRTRKLDREILEKSDIAFVMENKHYQEALKLAPQSSEKVFLLTRFYSQPGILPPGTDIPDPIGMDNFFYENVNEMIQLCCESVLRKLKEEMPAGLPCTTTPRTSVRGAGFTAALKNLL